MTTWWEERTALIAEATAIIAAQTGCSPSEAIAQLRQRAEAAETDLEDVATLIVASRTLFST
jgi:AmiR/NasT family two-component response regulator